MVFDFLPPEIEPWVIIGLAGGLISWLSHQSICLRIQRKRTWRLERGFVLSLKLQADLTKMAHPKDKNLIDQANKIEEFVNVVLKPDADSETDNSRF